MALQSRQQAEEELASLGWWYHHITFPNGLRTGDGIEPGYNPKSRWDLFAPHIPQDLSGKTVLDLGGNSGFFSIQMMLRGAAKCVLVEPYEEFVAQARFAAKQFSVELEIVTEDAHAYCLTTDERFDYVLLLGLLYHLRYPMIVLDRAAEMTRERLVIASNIIGPPLEQKTDAPDLERYRDDVLLEDPTFPKVMFIEKLYNGDPTNWWMPNHAALSAMVRSAGMKVVARPHSHLIVAQPEEYFGKVKYGNLVFPKYGKRGGDRQPGTKNVDATLWSSLSAHAARFRAEEKLRAKDIQPGVDR